jgi:hypothetical protein
MPVQPAAVPTSSISTFTTTQRTDMNHDPLLELRADGPVVVLTFEVGETSKLVKRFIDELTTLAAPATKKPLVYTTGSSFAAVYRAVPKWAYDLSDGMGRPLFSDIARRIADIRSDYTGRISFAITDELVASDGAWAQNRTPETTPRFQLPVFDSEATSRALAALVERWTAAGHIVAIQRPAQPTWEPDYTERPNNTPSRDLDPMVRRAAQVAHDAPARGTRAEWLD